MVVWSSPSEVSRSLAHAVVTIGNFDGVHLGHQRIIASVCARARQSGGTSVALTFDPHPVRVLAPHRPFRLLTPMPEKVRLFEAAGLDAVLVLRFTQDIVSLKPEEFVRGILVDCLQAKEILVGGSFRFGHRQTGNVDLLWEMGAKLGFGVQVVDPVQARGGVVSSTRIRELIATGRIGAAGRLLGRFYAVQGPVIAGRGIGKRQVVPTLNLAPYPELLPLRGVYITETECGGVRGPSVTNIGTNPTFGETELHLESHMLQPPPEDAAHADEMRVVFHHRIRDEIKFPNAGALRARIASDIAAARRYFRRRSRIRQNG
jgi:riboflavin kinase/FMN adenylyltransferase